MSSGTLKSQPKQKIGRGIALPAPPPPRSLDNAIHPLINWALNLKPYDYLHYM